MHIEAKLVGTDDDREHVLAHLRRQFDVTVRAVETATAWLTITERRPRRPQRRGAVPRR